MLSINKNHFNLIQKIIYDFFKKNHNYELNNNEYYDIILLNMKNITNIQDINIYFKKVIDNTINEILSKKNITLQEELLQIPTKKIQKHINERNEQPIEKIEYITIDSRDRNYLLYPDSSNYKIDILNLFNIISLELISAEIPVSQYLVNNSNNKLYFQELNSHVIGNIFLIANIPNGNYSLSELKTIIETTMNNTSETGALYTIDISTYSSQNKLKITSDMGGTTDLFNLIFRDITKPDYTNMDSSIGNLIGFSIKNFTGFTNYISNNQINLNKDTYLFLQVNNYKTIDGIASDVKTIFAKLSLDEQNGIKYYKNQDEYRIIKSFTPPLIRLDELNISFKTFNNSLYDFGNLEHSLLFKVVSLNYKT